jgi:hypothetical protein
MTFLIPAPQYGAQHSHSAFALARSTESPSPPALAAPSPHARRATVGFRPDEPDRERDRDRDRRGSLERELGRGRPSTTGARHRSRSDAWGGRPTYTFTAAELAGVGMHRVGSPASGLGMRRGGSGGGDLRSASTGGPVGSGPGPGGMGGVAMSRESSWSGPTYTFTAEQLASAVPSRFREALPAPLPGRASARGVPDISIVTGTSSAGISSSRVHSRVPSRVPSPTREDAIPAPTARLARTPEPPTFTFTAAELAAVGELGERERRASLGVHKWKALLPRRLSAPAEGVPKLSRSLSRGER